MWPFKSKKKENAVPSIEDAMRQTGLSEAQLERLFLEDLFQRGVNPFSDAPDSVRLSLERKHPDLVARAKKQFGYSPLSVGTMKIPRNHETLPSVVLMPVPNEFSYAYLARLSAAQAADKQLVHVMTIGWASDQADAQAKVQAQTHQVLGQLHAFVDDPKLELLRIPMADRLKDNLIIRATFMRDTAGEIEQTTLPALAERLTRIARERGLHVKTGGL
jgi:hypothetical protein